LRGIISILLVSLLLVTETRAAFTLHFCEGKLVAALLNIGQESEGCDMDSSPYCYSVKDPVSKSNCCSNSAISLAQTNSYKVFTFDNFTIKTPVLSTKYEQLISSSYLKVIHRDLFEDPPPFKQTDRSHLQVYLI
jgi:hypothetical protein